MEMRLSGSGGSEPLQKAIGVAIWQPGHQKFSNFSACKAQGNQHEIRIAFSKCNKVYACVIFLFYWVKVS